MLKIIISEDDAFAVIARRLIGDGGPLATLSRGDLKQDIVISNPLLDYAYSRQDIENMVIATTRSHKDSEEYNIAIEEAITNRSSSKK